MARANDVQWHVHITIRLSYQQTEKENNSNTMIFFNTKNVFNAKYSYSKLAHLKLSQLFVHIKQCILGLS